MKGAAYAKPPNCRAMRLRLPAALFLMMLFLLPATGDVVEGLVIDSSLQQLQQELNGAVAGIRPSVVSIRAEKKMSAGQNNASLLYESIGSGFVVDKRGYILTNFHVVEGSGNIRVSLWRSRGDAEYSARIVDAEESLDLALLRIGSNEPLIPARLGNSDRIKIGDWVLCAGSPFGFEHTVTLGVASDMHRDLVINGVPYNGMIQTDAVINQGNSGGPLVDVYGRVVGVATAIYAPNGTYTGVSFAIPINRARRFFTLTTGAVTAAAASPVNPPAAGAREAVNLNDRIPGDATHKEFADCTRCHVIARKSIVNTRVPMPHPMVGACGSCHILTNEPVRQGPTPVAALVRKPAPGGAGQSAGRLSNVIVPGTLAALALSALFALFGARLHAKVLIVPRSNLLRFLLAFVVIMAGLCTVFGVLFG